MTYQFLDWQVGTITPVPQLRYSFVETKYFSQSDTDSLGRKTTDLYRGVLCEQFGPF